MADKKLTIVAGFLFCGLVLMLLLILYYPDTSDMEDGPEDRWTPKISIKSWKEFDYNTEAPEPESKIAVVAKVIQDMGASFLALLAVICIAVGLVCLTCACCCVA